MQTQRLGFVCDRCLRAWAVAIIAFFLAADVTNCQEDSSRVTTESLPAAIVESLPKLLTLKIENDRWVPEMCTNYREASAAFESMGSGMSSSTGGGPSQWNCFRESKSWIVTGRYTSAETGQQNEAALGLLFEFVDSQASGWRFRATANEKGAIGIWALRKDTADLFWFQQRPEGKVSVVSVAPGRIDAGFAADYGQLRRAQPVLADDVLASRLWQWGLTANSGRFSIQVRDLLLQRFAPPDDSVQESFARTLAELEDAQFETRRLASKWLEENARTHLGPIMAELLSGELAPESRSRLRASLETTLDPQQFACFCQIERQQLADDPEVLVWLIDESEFEPTRQAIISHLQRVTGQQFAGDTKAWQQWLFDQGKSTATSSPTAASDFSAEYPVLSGPLSELAPSLTDLLPLTVVDGRIQWNRAHWSALYGEKSVEQLADDLKQFAIERGIPLDWISVHEEIPPGLDYPHLIFDRDFAQKARTTSPQREGRSVPRRYPMRSAGPNPNPRVFGDRFQASLEVEEGRHLSTNNYSAFVNRPAGHPVLLFTLIDEENPSNLLFVGWWPEGLFRLVVASPDAVVQVFQKPDKSCALDVAVGDQTLHRQFDSADQLLGDAHVTEALIPFLSRCGINLHSPAADSR